MKQMESHIAKIVNQFHLDADKDMFLHEVRNRDKKIIKSIWIIRHRSLERVALQAGIEFETPLIIEANGETGYVTLIVTGKLNDKSVWSFGEASPRNLTSVSQSYPFAMAEKRAKDRVSLILLGIGSDFFSDSEADEFRQEFDPDKDADGKLFLEKCREELISLQSADLIRGWWKDHLNDIRSKLEHTSHMDDLLNLCKNLCNMFENQKDTQ